MFDHSFNVLLVLLWGAVAGIFVLCSWGEKRNRVGITVTYLAFFAIAHWIPMIVVLLPWYTPFSSLELNLLGFYQSLIAVISFVFGATIIKRFFQEFHAKRRVPYPARVSTAKPSVQAPANLPIFFVAIGLLFIFVIGPAIGNVPTLSAFISGINSLFQAGLFLLVWQGYERNSKTQIFIAWGIVLVWPIITSVYHGFLGYAAHFIITFTIFNAHLVRKPFKYILPLSLFGYLALSFFLGYWSVREDIRGRIWYGNSATANLDVRVDLASDLINAFRFFDPTNPDHLAPIDGRFNYNHLTGLTIQRIQANIVDYGYGETIVDAALMVIPRAIWVDKPITLGGDDVVRKYAGVGLLAGSLLPGSLMEFYLNFGTIGVIIGFLIIGTIIASADELAAKYLNRKDIFNFTLVLVPVFSLLRVTDSFIGIVGGSVSGFLTIYIVNGIIRSQIVSRRFPP